METKVCTKCGEELTLDMFGKDGNRLRADCKKCRKIYNKQYQQSNKKVIAERHKQYRIDNIDDLTEKAKQYYMSNKENIVIKKTQYVQENKERILEDKKQYYIENKEVIINNRKKYRREKKDIIAERKKQYYIIHKEIISERDKKYNKINKDIVSARCKVWREKNKEYIVEKSKQYAKANRDKLNNIRQLRRSRVAGLEYTLTNKQWEQTKKDFNNRCAYCGKETFLTREHLIPVTKNGEYGKANIIPACRSCNCSKGNKDFFEWYPKHKYYSKEREKFILEFLHYKNNIQQLALAL